MGPESPNDKHCATDCMWNAWPSHHKNLRLCMNDYIRHESRKSKQFSGLLSLEVKKLTCTAEVERGWLKDGKAYKVSKYVSSCPFPQNSNRSYHFTLNSVLLLGEWLSHLAKFCNGGKSYNSITSSRHFQGRKKSYFRHEDGMESLEWWRFFM